MEEAIRSRLRRFEELERLLADPKVVQDPRQLRLHAKEHAALKPVVELSRELGRVREQIRSTRHLLESEEPQPEMRGLAQAELTELEARRDGLERELESLVAGDDPQAERGAILELRAGTGGAEASLFCLELYRMYTRYAARRGWAVENLNISPTEVGGYKEAIFAVEGTAVFRRLKHERGVHRVQRVPATEASGRIHTSTVTVAVLPEAEEVEVTIEPKDLRVDVFRSSGPGGQGVNTTDSAVRLTHLPTGLVVTCQDERSQMKNRAKAMKVLRARLMEQRSQEEESRRSRERRAQIGTGERSEKIRTYNFPDRRVTDHRIGLTCHRLEEVLEGDLDELIDPLLEANRKARLAAG